MFNLWRSKVYWLEPGVGPPTPFDCLILTCNTQNLPLECADICQFSQFVVIGYTGAVRCFFSNDFTTSELRRLTGSLSQCGLRDLTTSTGCSRVWGYTRRPRSASSQARQVRRGRRTRQEWGETPLEIFYIYIIFIYIYSSFYHNWMRRVLVEEPTQGFLYIICMDISRSEY